MTQFNALSADEQENILNKISNHPFLQYIPDKKTRIFAYMTNEKKSA